MDGRMEWLEWLKQQPTKQQPDDEFWRECGKIIQFMKIARGMKEEFGLTDEAWEEFRHWSLHHFHPYGHPDWEPFPEHLFERGEKEELT